MSAPITSCKQKICPTNMCIKIKVDVLFKLAIFLFNLVNIYKCNDIGMAEIDSVLFDMKWPGPFDSEINWNDNTMVMKSSENELYYCVLPGDVKGAKEEQVITYDGPSEYELINPLFDQTTCSYRIETYWTYELCHGKHLRQYHEDKELKQKTETQEYFLGKFDRIQGSKDYKKEEDTTTEDGELKLPPTRVPTVTVEGLEFPYFQMNFTDGTPCDLTGMPRKTHMRYVCHHEGRGEIYELKETSTCEYQVIVLTSVLCRHPAYRQRSKTVNDIMCHSMEGAPRQPKALQSIELEKPLSSSQSPRKTVNIKMTVDGEVKEQTVTVEQEEGEREQLRVAEPLDTVQKVSPRGVVPHKTTTISPTTDAQLLKEFLTGQYCLIGGAGWWKYEFCFGQKAIQFHEDRQTKARDVILLGQWDEAAHLKWLAENPAKKPKLKGDKAKRSVSNMHVNGDICDITGKPRFVEVKLKCKENSNQPHSVSIYLVEPNTCEYILVIESPILCSVLEEVDENGVINVPQVLEKLKKP